MNVMARDIALDFKNKVQTAIGDKFSALILYGSCARGDNVRGSDIDLLLLLRNPLTPLEEEQLAQLKSEQSLAFDTLLSCFPYSEEAWTSWQTPFLVNLRNEGIRL
jgi:uncharacterized protein